MTQPYIGENAEHSQTQDTPLAVCHVSVSPRSSTRKGLTAGASIVLTLPSWSLAAPRCNEAPWIHNSLQRLGMQSLRKVLEGGKRALN